MSKLQHELVANAALLARIHVLRANNLVLLLWLWSEIMHAGSKHSTFTVLWYLYTQLYPQGVFVSASRRSYF